MKFLQQLEKGQREAPVQSNDHTIDLSNKYLKQILALIIVTAAMVPVGLIGGIIFWFSLHSNQELIKDCVSRERVESECQEISRERAAALAETLSDITEAYILCADKYDGDATIKQCVADKLAAQSTPKSSN